MKATLQSMTLLGLVLLMGATAWASPYPLEAILGSEEAGKLATQRITTTAMLLDRGAGAADRKKLARTSGIKLARLTRWVRMCDVLRIKGVGPQMTKLMAAAQVYTVQQLRKQRPRVLAQRLEQANRKVKITQTPPTAGQLRNWITQARKLKLVLK